jgi:hypothetical protein
MKILFSIYFYILNKVYKLAYFSMCVPHQVDKMNM